MKIIYLHQYFNTPSMWGSHRSYEMAKRLVKKGHKVYVLTSYTKGDRKKPFDTLIDGINVHWIPVSYSNHMSFNRRIWAFIKFSLFSIPYVINKRVDLIFATSTPLTICIPAILGKFFTGSKFIFEVRDLWPELPIAFGAIKNPFMIFLAKTLEKIAYYFSDAVIALSPGMKEGIVKAGKNHSNVAVIPNLCDFNLNQDSVPKISSIIRSINDDKPLIAFTGAFGLINNIEWIVELGFQLEKIDSNVQILLLGDGKTKDSIKNLIKLKNLNNRIKVEEPISKKNMPTILNNLTMSIITFNDLREMQNNSANKFFDSLATARPIIVNFGGWINELIKDNDCGIDGWRKPMCDIAEEVHKKCNDLHWLERAGTNSYNLGKRYFDRDCAAENLNKIFNSVINDNNSISHLAPEKYNLHQ